MAKKQIKTHSHKDPCRWQFKKKKKREKKKKKKEKRCTHDDAALSVYHRAAQYGRNGTIVGFFWYMLWLWCNVWTHWWINNVTWLKTGLHYFKQFILPLLDHMKAWFIKAATQKLLWICDWSRCSQHTVKRHCDWLEGSFAYYSLLLFQYCKN